MVTSREDRSCAPCATMVPCGLSNSLSPKSFHNPPPRKPRLLKGLQYLRENKGVLRRHIEQDEFDVKLKVKQLSESIKTFHSFLGKMDKQMDKVNVEAYNKQITNFGEAGEAVEDFLAESSDRLQVSTKKFDKAMQDFSVLSTQVSVLSTEVKEIATKINKGEGSAGELINNREYIENLNKTIKEFGVLIEDIKKNPKKYVNVSIF